MAVPMFRDVRVRLPGILSGACVNSFAETPPRPSAFEVMHQAATMIRKPSTGLRMGALPVLFEKKWQAPFKPSPNHSPTATMTRRKRLTFWGKDESDDSLPMSVIEGRKTVTADTVDDYYKPYGEYGDGSYAPGDLIEVYDLRRNLRCIIRATKVYNIKFGAIPEEVWKGEAFASAEEFRQCHVDALSHLQLHDDFELVTLHFELVEVVAP